MHRSSIFLNKVAVHMRPPLLFSHTAATPPTVALKTVNCSIDVEIHFIELNGRHFPRNITSIQIIELD